MVRWYGEKYIKKSLNKIVVFLKVVDLVLNFYSVAKSSISLFYLLQKNPKSAKNQGKIAVIFKSFAILVTKMQFLDFRTQDRFEGLVKTYNFAEDGI